jgi:hypothetical protein
LNYAGKSICDAPRSSTATAIWLSVSRSSAGSPDARNHVLDASALSAGRELEILFGLSGSLLIQ